MPLHSTLWVGRYLQRTFWSPLQSATHEPCQSLSMSKMAKPCSCNQRTHTLLLLDLSPMHLAILCVSYRPLGSWTWWMREGKRRLRVLATVTLGSGKMRVLCRRCREQNSWSQSATGNCPHRTLRCNTLNRTVSWTDQSFSPWIKATASAFDYSWQLWGALKALFPLLFSSQSVLISCTNLCTYRSVFDSFLPFLI